jgi:hypothetical protein
MPRVSRETGLAQRRITVEIVPRERHWTPAGATPARKLVRSITRQHGLFQQPRLFLPTIPILSCGAVQW